MAPIGACSPPGTPVAGFLLFRLLDMPDLFAAARELRKLTHADVLVGNRARLKERILEIARGLERSASDEQAKERARPIERRTRDPMEEIRRVLRAEQAEA